MAIKSTLLCVMFSLSLLGAPAAVGDELAVRAEPEKLIACAYVTVKETKLVSKATMAFVTKTARKAIPAERFESLTVIEDGTLADAKARATANKADVFLHVTVGQPKGIKYTRRIGRVRGRRGRRGTVTLRLWTLRSPVTVELSIASGKQWRAVKTTKLTSADVPGAEAEVFRGRGTEDISKAWPKGVRKTTRAGCERVLGGYFLRNVTLKAVRCGRAEAGDGGQDDNEAEPPGTLVKIELTNRSHSRILDATVRGEKYNESRKCWEPIDAPDWTRRIGRRRRRGGKQLEWSIPAEVDPGEKTFSMEVPVSDAVLLAMKAKKCRMVLHATPAVWQLRQPTQRHPLKPPPKPEPN